VIAGEAETEEALVHESAIIGEEQLTARQMTKRAEALWKQYRWRLKQINKDNKAERDGIAGPADTVALIASLGVYGLVDLIQFIEAFFDGDLISIAVLTSWLVPLITVMEYMRIGKYALIRYSDPKRGLSRVQALTKKATWRLFVKTMVRILEWIPVVAAGPFLSLTRAAEEVAKRYNVWKLKRLRNQTAASAQTLRRRWKRAKTPEAKLATASEAMAVIKMLDRKFAKL
jgi:uncharacterized membrane-anchored protein